MYKFSRQLKTGNTQYHICPNTLSFPPNISLRTELHIVFVDVLFCFIFY